MFETIKALLRSKKALVAVLSALVWVLGKVGLDLDADAILPAVAPLWAYILGQGIADHGKEAELVRADSEYIDDPVEE